LLSEVVVSWSAVAFAISIAYKEAVEENEEDGKHPDAAGRKAKDGRFFVFPHGANADHESGDRHESTPSPFPSTMEIPTPAKKKTFSPTDHLPSEVVGRKCD